ncbi:MAG: DEAD/DEAH box helicase [Armatimonadota bacterium]|nr:DEAD/DEAH box helicase [bacterium]MDW8289950.1 DEAD/DEAH box helicase [Armatimonadota bacterium]
MRLAEYLQMFLQNEEVRKRVVHVHLLEATAGRAGTLSRPLPEPLERALRVQGVGVLYTHQAMALEAVRRGENVVVVSGTASGKTLCYNLPVLESVLTNPYTTAFYLFPTKALARDQQEKLNNLGLFPQVRFGVYDGDTPPQERAAIRRGAHLVLTNPDMLHVGILPHHSSWARFLRQLRYVVVDEMHAYRGVFGSHVALILRRLRRLAEFYGARPQFILTSATVGNPQETAQTLTGLPCTLIQEDGSPRPRRYFVLWNPPLIGQNFERLSTNVESAAILTALAEAGWSTLVFTKARVSTELILRYAHDLAERRTPQLKERLMSYRAGYTPEQRREIERRLFSGELLGVVSTNALELGVDVGGLDVVVMAGYPGSITSTWQQAGRAGRRDREAMVILVAQDDPLDQYLMRHPEYLFGQPVEKVRLNPTNLPILKAHLCCAAYEKPLEPDDYALFGDAETCMSAIAELMSEGRLGAREGRWYYFGGGYPAGEVSIRTASGEAVVIRESLTGSELGRVEMERAYRTVHPGAIYLHQGESYLIDSLDDVQRVALATPVWVDYYTEPLVQVQLQVLSTHSSRWMGALEAGFGEVRVVEQVVGFRRKHLRSGEIIDVEPLQMPEQSYDTEGAWLTFDMLQFLRSLAGQFRQRGAAELDILALLARDVDRTTLVHTADGMIAMHGAEHALQAVVPLTCGCERMDVGSHFSWLVPAFGRSAIFLYDTTAGGTGISRGAYEEIEQLLQMASALVRECPCREGCPSCLHSPMCPARNGGLDKRQTLLLLEWLQEQRERAK